MQSPFGNDNRQPSSARQNGRQAVADAIQHHMDRLGPNQTRAIYRGPLESMQPASGPIRHVSLAQRAAQGFTGFTPKQQGQANSMARQNNPLGRLGSKVEHYLQLRQFGKQTASMFNPTTKAGLMNDAAMFVPGAAGGGYGSDPLPEDILPQWNPKGEFRNYNMNTGNALDRGISNEGPNPGAKGAGIRGLVRRAQGVGGYRGNGPEALMQGIEMRRAAQGAHNQFVDENKLMANDAGAQAMKEALMKKMGGEPYSPLRSPGGARFDNQVPVAYKTGRSAAGPAPGRPDLMQMLHDMLFGGLKGRKPPTPGGGPLG